MFNKRVTFKCLGSAVNQNNIIEEEIKERIIAGNKAFCADQKSLKTNYYHRNLN
jgi:hypothetical protein